MSVEDLARIEITRAEDLRRWLEDHHADGESVLLVTFKKTVPQKYVSNNDVLDELVAFDWMDGRRFKLDEERTMQLISPRKTHHWSKTYKDRAAKLIDAGRMHEAGFRGIERAKKNGGWTFFDDVDALIVPDDLKAALRAKPPALENYAEFPPSTKRDILRWVKVAKTETTRAKRIGEVASKAARNERASGTM
jgi:uncharacterized protein YdeI (YjbR/CyaY-like superfamily)